MHGADIKKRPVRVCDHALLRFVERVGGLDVEGLRRHLEDSLKRAVTVADAIDSREVVVVADGLKYIVVRGTVVTVLGPTQHPKRVKARSR
jgi:hypothetical protein